MTLYVINLSSSWAFHLLDIVANPQKFFFCHTGFLILGKTRLKVWSPVNCDTFKLTFDDKKYIVQ
jgi:hypothetical protein